MATSSGATHCPDQALNHRAKYRVEGHLVLPLQDPEGYRFISLPPPATDLYPLGLPDDTSCIMLVPTHTHTHAQNAEVKVSFSLRGRLVEEEHCLEGKEKESNHSENIVVCGECVSGHRGVDVHV